MTRATKFESQADHISGRIIDMLNEERGRDPAAFCPTAALAGQCLALLALMRTAPPGPRPGSFDRLGAAAHEVVVSCGRAARQVEEG